MKLKSITGRFASSISLFLPYHDKLIFKVKLGDVCGFNAASFTVYFRVFGQKVDGQDCGEEASKWISTCLNKDNHRYLTYTHSIMYSYRLSLHLKSNSIKSSIFQG